jgi:hypothetical protein
VELTDGLKEASESEVIAWFDVRPEYKEMLIQDMRKNLGLHFLKEFKYVFEHIDFLLHPTIGMIPGYLIHGLFDSVGNVANKPDFELCGYDDECNRYLYKRPWFLIWIKENYGEIESGIDHLEQFVNLVNQFSSEMEEYREGLTEYFYGWANRVFSNGKRFVSVAEINEFDISKFRDSEVLEGTEPGGDVEIYAAVLESDEGKVFIRISGVSGEYLMDVASNEEAEQILNEIWG